MSSATLTLIVVGCFWAVAAFIAGVRLLTLRSRSPQTNYEVELATTRPRMPDHCVLCGAAHPTERLRIYARVSPSLSFPYCRSCAAPVRRERTIAATLAIIGAIAFVGGFLMMIGFVPMRSPSHDVATLGAVGGYLILYMALYLRQFGPGVSVSKGGTLFRFSNRHFRDAFAAINDVE